MVSGFVTPAGKGLPADPKPTKTSSSKAKGGKKK